MLKLFLAPHLINKGIEKKGQYRNHKSEHMDKKISPVSILVTDEPVPSFGNFYRMKELTARPSGQIHLFPGLYVCGLDKIT
jgi:hypothetical protein